MIIQDLVYDENLIGERPCSSTRVLTVSDSLQFLRHYDERSRKKQEEKERVKMPNFKVQINAKV